ncbi:MAG: rRNA pseudouridine synthase [Oscillospiraceae bacterium]|nr:rRNA pseudouridine synthase [Oscillospiraceae bacterium]
MALSRLDRMLSASGKYTRSQAKDLIRSGRVSVDGVCMTKPEVKCEESAMITVNGEALNFREFHYIMLNKPAGVLSATEDRKDTVALDLLPAQFQKLKLFPAGRLDKDAEGFLLLTNDGQLAHGLMSPRRHVDKVYYVRVEGEFCEKDKITLQEGVIIDGDYKTMPAKLQILDSASEAEITVQEGRFHQVKKMCLACGCRVVYLKRLSIAGVRLDPSLQTGEFRSLTEEEEAQLKREAGM